jgi:hypothetical protein
LEVQNTKISAFVKSWHFMQLCGHWAKENVRRFSPILLQVDHIGFGEYRTASGNGQHLCCLPRLPRQSGNRYGKALGLFLKKRARTGRAA